jgi:hypothetical protein
LKLHVVSPCVLYVPPISSHEKCATPMSRPSG